MAGIVSETNTQSAHPVKIEPISRIHTMPFGAEYLGASEGTCFQLWAPSADSVSLELNNISYHLPKDENGWYRLQLKDAGPGTLYQYRINNQLSVPDPASRYQPKDVHGPSQVMNPSAFQWNDLHWKGRSWTEAIIYELHVGTFTPEGSFQGVKNKLEYLVDLGITAIELMPLSDFPGSRDWGYNGVLPFSPDSRYGTPDDLKELVQAAHQKGLMVFLDVVYNHFGPEGNYLHSYAQHLFTEHYHTPWGQAINFEGSDTSPEQRHIIRDFFIQNALYWLEEFHLDGLRLDAVQEIHDSSSPHFLTELAEAIHQQFPDRHIHLILENPSNESRYLKPELYDAQWNDDFHHAMHTLLTGETIGYYGDYTDAKSTEKAIVHLARCLTEGFAYQGQFSNFHQTNRGEKSSDCSPLAFIHFLQNHDQIGNRALGERISKLTSAAALKAAIGLLLLSPSIPMLFMGEEWQTEKPFLFFCDFEPGLAENVREGRKKEFASFPDFNNPELQKKIPDPLLKKTFELSHLDWKETNQPPYLSWHAYYKHLLEIRQNEIIPRLSKLQEPTQSQYHTFGETGLLARWGFKDGSELYLIANLGDVPAACELSDADKSTLMALAPIWQTNHQTLQHIQDEGSCPAWSVVWALTSGVPE